MPYTDSTLGMFSFWTQVGGPLRLLLLLLVVEMCFFFVLFCVLVRFVVLCVCVCVCVCVVQGGNSYNGSAGLEIVHIGRCRIFVIVVVI